MVMVYDSALPSRSIPTLIGLGLTVIIIYAFQAAFDILRSRMMSDVSMGLDRELAREVQEAIYNLALRGHRYSGDGLLPMRDLDNVRSFLGGSGAIAVIDLPWVIFFLAVLFLMHMWLGVAALLGVLFLIALTWLTDQRTKSAAGELSEHSGRRIAASLQNLQHLELLTSLGMRRRALDRWAVANQRFNLAQLRLTYDTASAGAISRVFRLFLQSAVLTVGAWLVIHDQASAGIIFASSIIAGRALAPIDQAIAHWRSFVAARSGWKRLSILLAQPVLREQEKLLLPSPSRELGVDQLVVAPPGGKVPTLHGVTFRVEAGTAVGIVGPSGAGKSSLGRTLVGAWLPAQGDIRLDGARIDQWDGDDLGQHIGYLPQSVELLGGTVAENISRFDKTATSDRIIAAARAAGAHDLIVSLADGYQTQVGSNGEQLSAGQRQRIGLARALYGDPFLVVLDEPNSNLDAVGEFALADAILGIKARKGILLIITHRPGVLDLADQIMVLGNGRIEAMGPRDRVLEVLRRNRSPVQVKHQERSVPVTENTLND